MRKATQRMRHFAERLIAQEMAEKRGKKMTTSTAFLVCETLRLPLATLMGDAGFSALLSRALSLATAELPALAAVRVDAHGTLHGLPEPEAQLGRTGSFEGGATLLAHLLGLLTTLVGEDLTQRLVRDVWPKLVLDTLDPAKGTIR